ncbi:DUF3120 domain-containing protein [Synechocystis sp. LKSZ1]|uniref:DUF3120 domain-containing protein n=1 Tax=Synechocystis sp. LKSZ1 TaxID=3144951 RepID=UPI00336C274B
MIPLLTTVITQYALRSRYDSFPVGRGSRLFSQVLFQVLLASGFLVSVPVFIQAPLVREWPWLGLGLTLGWVGLAVVLLQSSKTQLWGDLLIGFSWSWLTGALYWGWFRWEPLVHLPIEALGLPLALWGIARGWGRVGHFFYLGSLLGTAITDVYFYLTGLIPAWRQLMVASPELISPILHQALEQIQTFWGVSWGIALVGLLLGLGTWALQKNEPHWWALAGAILSTILVDSLFLLAAILA